MIGQASLLHSWHWVLFFSFNFMEFFKNNWLRIVFLQDSDGEAGIALVGVHSDFPKYEVNILPIVICLIEISSYINLLRIIYLIYVSSYTPYPQCLWTIFFSSDNMPHLGHWNEKSKKDSLYFLRYGANPNEEKCPNSTGGATVG